MSTIDLSDENIVESWNALANDQKKNATDNWMLLNFVAGTKNKLQVLSKGTGGLAELKEQLKDDEVMFGILRVGAEDRKEQLTSVRQKFMVCSFKLFCACLWLTSYGSAPVVSGCHPSVLIDSSPSLLCVPDDHVDRTQRGHYEKGQGRTAARRAHSHLARVAILFGCQRSRRSGHETLGVALVGRGWSTQAHALHLW